MTGRGESAQITVVVASYKRPEALQTVLLGMRRQTLPTAEFELAVVVDGVDEYQEQYRKIFENVGRELGFSLRYEFQQNAGQSVARHRAILGASTPWICVIDDDMDLLPEFLAEHLAILRSGTRNTIVIGRVIPEEGWESAPLYEAVRTCHMLEMHEALARRGTDPSGYTFVTQNVSFSRDFYLAVGGFDPELRLGEDSELGLRFEFARGEFVFGSRAAAIHRSRVGSYDQWLRRCVEYGRNGVYIYEKLRQDPRAHPLRNLVDGSRLNAAAVHTLCWSDRLAYCGIAALHSAGNVLQRLGLFAPAISTHKAILALAFHIGVKHALGSWRRLRDAERAFSETAAAQGARDPT